MARQAQLWRSWCVTLLAVALVGSMAGCGKGLGKSRWADETDPKVLEGLTEPDVPKWVNAPSVDDGICDVGAAAFNRSPVITRKEAEKEAIARMAKIVVARARKVMSADEKLPTLKEDEAIEGVVVGAEQKEYWKARTRAIFVLVAVSEENIDKSVKATIDAHIKKKYD